MNKDRINNVIRALEETPHKNRFDMSSWGHPCGTPACAIGNYAARRDLQDAFRLNAEGHLINVVHGYCAYLENDVAPHFDIDATEADLLFGARGCGGATTTEQAVAFLKWYVTKPEFAQTVYAPDSESDSEDDE